MQPEAVTPDAPPDADQLAAELVRIGAQLDRMEAKFDETREQMRAGLAWLVKTVDRIRLSGVRGLLSGVDRHERN